MLCQRRRTLGEPSSHRHGEEGAHRKPPEACALLGRCSPHSHSSRASRLGTRRALHCHPVLTACRGCLAVARTPSVSRVLTTAALIADRLGLQLPPVNAQALAHRYVAELGLPREVGDAAARMLLLHAPKGALVRQRFPVRLKGALRSELAHSELMSTHATACVPVDAAPNPTRLLSISSSALRLGAGVRHLGAGRPPSSRTRDGRRRGGTENPLR